MDCEKLKNFLNEEDVFCRYCGIRLTEAAPGKAEAVMEITPEKYNSRNVVQGGAIMTLADFAFAGAANAMGHTAVSTNVSTNFIRPGTGRKLIARAEKVHHGRTTCLYQVRVENDCGQLIATASISGFIIDEKPVIGE